MTGNKCLLDTSIVIHAFRKNNSIADRLDAIQEIYIPVEVIGELYYGAYRSVDPARHITQIRSFIANCTILSADSTTADTYGQIKAALMQKGKPIPENDIWIAAIAHQHDLPLYTTDKHFTEINSIRIMS